MLALGRVKPGSTVIIPWETFKGSDGSPITQTGLAVSDIIVFKDGGMTERASTSGFTLLDTDGIDLDGRTGLHGVSLDLSDNTTADFWQSGSQYQVAIDAVTVDGVTMRFWGAIFRIGYEGAILDTFLATLTSQTVFTLNAGPANDNALIGCPVIVHAPASAVQIAQGIISAYVGSTKQVTLSFDPAVYTLAVKCNISVFPRANVYAIAGQVPSLNANNRIQVSLKDILDTVLTETAGLLAAAFKKFFNVATPTGTVNSIPDAVAGAASGLALVGSNVGAATSVEDVGSTGLSSIAREVHKRDTAAGIIGETSTSFRNVVNAIKTEADSVQADLTTLLSRLTSARAGYLDNLNVGGAVATHADILALNTSASKHLILITVQQYERPESGSTIYTVECRTFGEDGADTDADTTPTMVVTGQTSGNLAANLGVASHPATGLYRWTYTVAAGATVEPLRFDVSATIAAAVFTLSTYAQVVDEVSATWTSTDQTHLTTIFNKLPTNGIADQTDLTAVKAKTDNIPSDPADASDIAALLAAIPAAVWAYVTRTLTAFGFTVNTNANATETTIKAKTDLIPTVPSSQEDVVAVGTAVDSIPAATDALMTASHGSGSYVRNTEPSTPPTVDQMAVAILDKSLAGHVTAGTVGHALQLARAQGGGDWSVVDDVLTIKDLDGTPLVSFDLAPAGGPYSSRTA